MSTGRKRTYTHMIRSREKWQVHRDYEYTVWCMYVMYVYVPTLTPRGRSRRTLLYSSCHISSYPPSPPHHRHHQRLLRFSPEVRPSATLFFQKEEDPEKKSTHFFHCLLCCAAVAVLLSHQAGLLSFVLLLFDEPRII